MNHCVPFLLSLKTNRKKKSLLSLWIFVCLVFFKGCTTLDTDSSSAQPVTVQSSWSTPSERITPSSNSNWLNDFDDKYLKQFVKEALEYNYDIRAAAARLEQARYQTTIAGADRWPQASGETGGSRRRTNFIGFPFGGGGEEVISSRSESFELLLNLSWEIDLWGRLRNRHQAAIQDWEAAQAEFRGARLSLAAETARTWFNVIEAKLQVALAQETVESFSRNTDFIQDRYERGLSTALDLRLARSNEASARATLASRKAEQDQQKRQLEVILGRYPSSNTLNVIDALPSLHKTIPVGLPSELLKRRPDIIAAEKRLNASVQLLLEARKAFLPSISLTGRAGTESNDLKDLLNNNFSIWTIAGNLVQPVFQGRLLVAAAKQAKEIQIERIAQYGEIALQAFREVETALAAERLLQEREENLNDAQEEAMASERLAWDQYRKGLVDIITLLETERRSFDARSQHLGVLNQQLQNRITLYLALGGDFDLD